MARITVDDCLQNVENRFDLILLAARRARELGIGAPPTVPPDRDKHTMIALRELAAGTVRPEALQDTLIKDMQHALPEDDDDTVPTNSEDQEEFAEYVRRSGPISIDVDADLKRNYDSPADRLAEIPEPSDAELAELAIELGVDGSPG